MTAADVVKRLILLEDLLPIAHFLLCRTYEHRNHWFDNPRVGSSILSLATIFSMTYDKYR